MKDPENAKVIEKAGVKIETQIMIPIIDDFIKLFDYENEIIIIKNSDIFIREC